MNGTETDTAQAVDIAKRDRGTDRADNAAAGIDSRDAATRALAEAEERRKAPAGVAPEIDGRGGLEPVRYGDWEVKGLATDF